MKFNPFSKLERMLKNNRGYTLLFSVIVSVLVLSVAAFILSISRKQFILSSAARDSLYAFYAADSGLECAVEELNMQSGSPISTSSIYAIATGAQSVNLNCGNGTWAASRVTSPAPSLNAATTTWQMSLLGTNNSACSLVTAWYSTANSDGTGATVYYIDSRGYNIGWDSQNKVCNLYGPRRVERAIRYVVNE